MNPARQRMARQAREATPLEVQPLMLSWQDGDVVRATLRKVSDMSVIALGGPFDATAVEPCRRALEAALRFRPRNVVVDLGAVTVIGRECVPLLGAMRRKATWHGAQLWLAAVPDAVRVALEQAGALGLYPIERNTTRVVDIVRLRQTPSRGVPVPAHLAHRSPSNQRQTPSTSTLPSQPRTA